MAELIATWNPARGVWETGRASLLCEHSELFWETWPTSGMTRDGVAYALPTWAPLMDVSGCSSLPTPRATRGRSGTETVELLPTPIAAHEAPRNQNVWLRDDPRGARQLNTALALLPTPAVNDMGEGKTPEAWDEWTAKMQEKHGNGNDHGPSLAIETLRLLPTPRAQNGEDRNNLIYYRRDRINNIENALAPITPGSHGEPTAPQFDDGNESLAVLPLLLLSLDETGDRD